jgi:AmmeMemoRadiSam system protein B
MIATRPPAVAGSFYESHPVALRREVDALLETAPSPARAEAPKALIVPHAGHVYSGPIAASAYALLRPFAERYRRVVLLGPTHRVPLRGLGLPGVGAFATPLGLVPVDEAAVAVAARCPGVTVSPAAHAREHSLEVQLPFLQRVLPSFSLVPLAVGAASEAEVADVLEQLWGGQETLLVVSSDLSHFEDYDTARAHDLATARRFLALDGHFDGEDACGCVPVRGLLALARRRRLAIELVDLRSSGDTAGDKDRVVGYGAFAFYEREVSWNT